MKKRIALLALCGVLLSSISACSNNGQDVSISSPTSSESTTTESTDIASDNGKTIFIYMCGSNLETQQGLAGKNIDELISANVSDDVDIIIQTGGASKWRSHDISADKIERYTVKNGKLELLSSLDKSNMGAADTLSDFLIWGQENYASNQNYFIFWDHGGGTAKGICFDENYKFDSLTLPEIKQAFDSANLSKKFDIIGFDACLMASIEVAAVMRNYAEFMVASEEIEPSGGWNYKAMAESISSESDEVEIGKCICDTFVEKCNGKNYDAFSTLSVLDLSKIDPMLEKFTQAAEYLNRVSGTQNYCSQILNAAHQSEKFGIDKVFDGSSNMVDFINFNELVNISDLFAYFETQDFVPYSVCTGDRNNFGVSFYFPLTYEPKEIEDYISLGICDEYNEYLKSYYLNRPDKTIEFSDKGSIADDGSFSVTFSEDSHKYLAVVNCMLIQTDGDGTQHILSYSSDFNADWDNLTFNSNFKGIVPSLCGHRFYSKLHVDREAFLDYEVPVILNGKNTFIRYYYTPETNDILMPGSCDGFDENGLPVNEFVYVEDNSKVQVATDLTVKGNSAVINYSEEFTISDDMTAIEFIPLDGTTYQYVFVVTDIFGNTYVSDMATFEMQYSYDELLSNQLPDNTYAAKVTNIAPYSSNYIPQM